MSYSTKQISERLIIEIKDALEGLAFGSIEIYVQNNTVTQITVRNIKKVNAEINNNLSNQDTVVYKPSVRRKTLHINS